ncbi:MAG: hypothetical protein AAF519_02865 [Bacteroidota bacterium]
MTKSKKLFLFFAVLFFLLMIYVSYDISSRTTFPGSKPQLKERIFEHSSDSSKLDSSNNQNN